MKKEDLLKLINEAEGDDFDITSLLPKDPTPKDPEPKDPTPKDPDPKDPNPAPKDPTSPADEKLSLTFAELMQLINAKNPKPEPVGDDNNAEIFI